MTVWLELERRDVTAELGSGLTTRCRECGRELTLFYNGGELDAKICCGFRYELDAPRIDFVVTVRE